MFPPFAIIPIFPYTAPAVCAWWRTNGGNLIASCSTPPKDKMVIRTNTPRLQHHRKMILELLLAAHCRDCTICEKNQTCRLQGSLRPPWPY